MSWQRACAYQELAPNQGISVKLGSERIALFLVGESIYALRDRCPHQGALLSKGGAYSEDGEPIVVCPVHYWTFSLKSGACPYHPTMQAVVFPCELRGDDVWVSLPEEQLSSSAPAGGAA